MVDGFRASGEIGRRAGFRCLYSKGCGGSSPPSPTDHGHGCRQRDTTNPHRRRIDIPQGASHFDSPVGWVIVVSHGRLDQRSCFAGRVSVALRRSRDYQIPVNLPHALGGDAVRHQSPPHSRRRYRLPRLRGTNAHVLHDVSRATTLTCLIARNLSDTSD